MPIGCSGQPGCVETERAAAEVLSLLYPELTEDQVAQVCRAIDLAAWRADGNFDFAATGTPCVKV